MPKRLPKHEPTKPEIEVQFPTPEEVKTSVSGPTDNPDAKAARKGVFLPFKEDGTIDDKRLRGDTWKIDAARKALNLTPDAQVAGAAAGLEVSTDFVRGLYKGIEALIQNGGVYLLKWPRDLAQYMRYSEESKNRLVPPTKAVLEKLAPTWLVKHQEIATLAVVLAAETQTMVQDALQQYVAAHPELMQQPKPPQPEGSENRHAEPAAAAA